MRLKLQTTPPFPPLKAWYATGAVESPGSTVADLKAHLLAHVEVLRAALDGKQARIVLTLDDFELLDESNLDVLRDGDLICVGGTFDDTPEELPTRLGKRKRATADAASPKATNKRDPISQADATPVMPAERSAPRIGDPAKRMLGAALGARPPALGPRILNSRGTPKPPLSPVSSTSSYESSSEETDSDSTSESESDSDSDSTSSPSSDSGPPSSKSTTQPPISKPPPQTAVRSKLAPMLVMFILLAHPNTPCNCSHVPPGQGLPRTHSRNKRKRIKRQAARLETAPPPPPPGTSAANAIPLVESPPTSAADITGPAQSVMEALNGAFSNNAHGGTLEPGDIPPSPSYTPNHQPNGGIELGHVMMSSLRNKNKKKGFKNSLNRPIPQKIVFSDAVTESAEKNDAEMTVVEKLLQEERQPPPRLVPPSEKQRRGELPSNMFVTSIDVEAGRWSTNEDELDEQADAQELPYDEIEPPPTYPSTGSPFDWPLAESKFTAAKVVDSQDQLRVGMYVGWMDLAINPESFTPEYLLTVSRITATIPAICVKPLLRPGAANISFSNTSKFAEGEGEDQEDQEMEGEEESFSWEAVSQASWKILDFA